MTTKTRSKKAAPKKNGAPKKNSDAGEPFWRTYRQELVFLLVFIVLLGGSFSVIALKPVNDHVIEPFTAAVAEVSGRLLVWMGQASEMRGTEIRGPSFAVDIRNGCNGVETMLIFCSAVLAFPAPWRSRLVGLGFGLVAIQVVNVVRIVALYLTGVYLPKLFDTSHTVVWQTVVILFGVLLWIYWANRWAVPKKAEADPAAEGAEAGAGAGDGGD